MHDCVCEHLLVIARATGCTTKGCGRGGGSNLSNWACTSGQHYLVRSQ